MVDSDNKPSADFIEGLKTAANVLLDITESHLKAEFRKDFSYKEKIDAVWKFLHATSMIFDKIPDKSFYKNEEVRYLSASLQLGNLRLKHQAKQFEERQKALEIMERASRRVDNCIKAQKKTRTSK